MPAPGMSVEDFIAMIQQQRSEDLGADAEAADDVLNRVLSSGFGDDDDDETDETEESEDIVIEDLGSELSEESYDYDPPLEKVEPNSD
jgi:hypothetical protein